MKSIPLLSLFAVLGVSCSEKPAAAKTTASAEQLQRVLGIQTWNVTLPSSFGESGELFLELTTAEGKTVTSGNSEIKSGKEIFISFHESNGIFHVYNEESSGASSSQFQSPVSTFTNALPAEFSYVSTSSRPPAQEGNELVLATWEYGQAADPRADPPIPSKIIATRKLLIRPAKR